MTHEVVYRDYYHTIEVERDESGRRIMVRECFGHAYRKCKCQIAVARYNITICIFPKSSEASIHHWTGGRCVATVFRVRDIDDLIKRVGEIKDMWTFGDFQRHILEVGEIIEVRNW
jgi:hypothetical protein